MEPEREVTEEPDTGMEKSLHALSGAFNPRTIKLAGTIRGQQLTIGGNFIQHSVAYKLGIAMRALPEFRVFIGSGDFLTCKEVCPHVPIRIQETTIVQDLHVLTMEGANVVLDVQWLETLGPVMTNYKQLTIQFEIQGSAVKFQGSPHLGDLAISKSGLRRMMAKKEVTYFCHLACDPPPVTSEVSPEIELVLNSYPKIFDAPEKLPPSRVNDHHIELEPGA